MWFKLNSACKALHLAWTPEQGLATCSSLLVFVLKIHITDLQSFPISLFKSSFLFLVVSDKVGLHAFISCQAAKKGSGSIGSDSVTTAAIGGPQVWPDSRSKAMRLSANGRQRWWAAMYGIPLG